MLRRFLVLSTLALVLILPAACAAPAADSENAAAAEAPAAEEAAGRDVEGAPQPEPAEGLDDPSSESSATNAAPIYNSWDEVLNAAQGTTVTWSLWGGSETINAHVDEFIGQSLLEAYGVTLERAPLDNTADAVNQVLNEKAAGRESSGSIDAIWINGDNFRALKDAGALYGPFVAILPNAGLVDWRNAAVGYDFGVAVDGYESPWAGFQWVLEYNRATVGDNPPRTFDDLRTWIEENPGRFTYPAPPNHVGAAFVRQLFYWAAGSPEPFLGEFDQAVFNEYAPVVWEYLNAIEPNLWRGGQTYPDPATMTELLANQAIDFNMEYDSSRASTYIREGLYPDAIRTTVLESGTLANVSYIAIPYNASNPAGALVLANYLLSPEYQTAITDPEILGWKMVIDPTRLSEAEQAALAETTRGVATLSADALSSAALPEMNADWLPAIERGWEENVLQR